MCKSSYSFIIVNALTEHGTYMEFLSMRVIIIDSKLQLTDLSVCLCMIDPFIYA